MAAAATSQPQSALAGLLASLLWFAAGTLWVAPSAKAAPVEYQIKAVFLYNFSQFITWPQHAFADTDAPFRLCVLGRDPFGILLDVTLEGQRSAHRPIEVLRLSNLDQAWQCQILFLAAGESARSPEVLKWASRRPILTISDQPGFAAAGGAIELKKIHSRIQLLINRSALQHSGLKAHANLLRLADVLGEDSQ